MENTIILKKDAQGEVLEVAEITGIGFPNGLKTMDIIANVFIQNVNRKFVPIDKQVGYYFNEDDLTKSANFTEEEAQEFIDLKNQFFADLIELVNRKAEIESEEVEEDE